MAMEDERGRLTEVTLPSGLARLGRLELAVAGLSAGVLAVAPWPIIVVGALAAGAMGMVAFPFLGLVAAAWAVPFGSLAAMPTGAAALTPAPVGLALAAFGRALAAVARRTPLGVPAAARLALGGVGVFLATLVASSLAAADITAAGVEVARWGLLGLALALAAMLDRRAGVALVAVILVAGAVEAVMGVALAVRRVGPEAFAVLGGRLYRAHGTFGQPNPFAGYMNMVWPIGAALAWTTLVGGRASRNAAGHRRRNRDALRGRASPACTRTTAPPRPAPIASRVLAIVGTLAAGLCGVGLVLSWSRGGWLSAAVAGGAMLLAWFAGAWRGGAMRRRVLGVTWAGLTVVVALLLAGAVDHIPASIGERLGSIARTFAVWGVADVEVTDANFATIERVAHWEAAAAMWTDRPWLGQGPGMYADAYPRFRLPRWSDPLGHAHNIYLHLLAEGGLVGLAGYLVFYFAGLAAILRAAWRPTGEVEAALGLGLVGVWAALAFHSLLDNLFVHDLTIHLGLLLGALVGQRDAAPSAGAAAVRARLLRIGSDRGRAAAMHRRDR